MAFGDDSYELDDAGNRVLIGLSAAETEEFLALDADISRSSDLVQMSQDEWGHPHERRWLELYEKHTAAKEPFLKAGKTRH